jgi:hypothetical protein
MKNISSIFSDLANKKQKHKKDLLESKKITKLFKLTPSCLQIFFCCFLIDTQELVLHFFNAYQECLETE